MDIGKIIERLRKGKGWSQSELAEKTNVSRVMIGKYERNEATPSIDATKSIADAFEVSLDYLVGVGLNASFDKKMLARLEDVENLPSEEKERIFHFMDLVIRDTKAKKAYAS